VQIVLVNTNLVKPPIAPIGLEYVAEAVHASGHSLRVLDLCWEKDVEKAVEAFFSREDADIVGITFRNTDDCAFASRVSFLSTFTKMVGCIRNHTNGLIVLGGVGFSVMPEEVLEITGADAGIWGEGEFAFPELANRISEKKEWMDIQNLIWKRDGEWTRNAVQYGDLRSLPVMQRRWIDNARYFHEGGQAGFETKRGCPGQCTYCADPIAKGRKTRLRSPGAVTREIKYLLDQGIDALHTCDSEFNIPEMHALEVCDAMIQRGFGEKLQWYAYCAPVPFSRRLAVQMKKAGCAGINFGVDHGDPEMLKRLKRFYEPEDILDAAQWCHDAGITVMFDLLIGSPSETRRSIQKTIELMKESRAERVGIALGIRIYPGTEMAEKLLNSESSRGLIGGKDPALPLFYLEPAIASEVSGWLEDMTGGDSRFLFFNPMQAGQNYNYNANQVLVDAIRDGHRGAYWDILRKIKT